MKRIIALFVTWKVAILLFALIAPLFLTLNQKSWLGFFHATVILPYPFWIWANSDGVNYLDIARNGYIYPNFAFFPLLPLLTFLVNDLFNVPNTLAGLLVSNISAFLSFVMLYKITLLDFNKRIAWRTLILFAAFPVSFYLGAVYADSLFFFLSTSCFYFARKKKWFWAGLFGYFATLTRLVGIVLFVALVVEWFLQHRKLKLPPVSLFLAPLGIVTYGTYLKLLFGDFFLFQKAMIHWNQEKVVFPLQVVFRYIKIFLFASKNIVYFVAVVEFVATFFYFFLAGYVFKKVRISYGIFMLGVFLLPTFTGTFQSMPRYILHVFPAFIALALLTKKSKKRFWITILGFLILQGIFVALFTRGYFVA